jgi:hypothetical protein
LPRKDRRDGLLHRSPPRGYPNRPVHAVVSRSNGTTVKDGLLVKEAQKLAAALTDGCSNEEQREAWNLIEQGWTDAEIVNELDILHKEVVEYRRRRKALIA